MAPTLPLGIRVAAGVLGTALDRLGTLPRELPGMAVTVAGQALRTSMRVRQEIAELATRGDDLLAPLTGRSQEHPPWATFDDDEDADSAASTAPSPGAARSARDDPWSSSRAVVQPDPIDTADLIDTGNLIDTSDPIDTATAAGGPWTSSSATETDPFTGADVSTSWIDADEVDPAASFPDLSAPAGTTPAAATDDLATGSDLPPTTAASRSGGDADGALTTAAFVAGNGAAPEVTLAGREPGDVVPLSTGSLDGPDGPTRPASPTRSTSPTRPKSPTRPESPAGIAGPATVDSAADSAADGSAIGSDHQLSIAELKERLLDLDAAGVRALLAQEETGPNRAAYLTLLGNRLMTLQHDDR